MSRQREEEFGRYVDEFTKLQADHHPVVATESFPSVEKYVLHLIHRRAYEEALKYANGARVLDWGCNQGFGLEMLASVAQEVSGLDVNPKAVETARARLGDRAKRLEVSDGVTTSFEPGSFDVVVSFAVIEHIEQWRRYLETIGDLLVPGGVALFMTGNGAIRVDEKVPCINRFHCHEYDAADFRECLETVFPSVEMLGLAGDPEIHRVALARIEQLRAGALHRQRWRRGVGGVVRRIGRTVTAWRYLQMGWKRLAGPDAPPEPIGPDVLARFSTDQLHYAEDRASDGIHLLAVCRKD